MSNGRYGAHGGQYVPETLMNAVLELQKAYETYKKDPQFIKELRQLYHDYANRPSLLYYAEQMTQDLGGAKIYLKREDLNHTGAHKINNALGQCLLAKKMGKKRIIAETGAGQHGVATATVAALLGLECVVYMGKLDTERQALNVYRMKLLGADVVPVETGTKSLKDAVNEALREWSARCEDTAYCIGSVMGPHPYPMMVRDFQKVIGEEVRQQMLEKEGRLPDVAMACVGGGSNAMGLFYDFIPDPSVQLIGVEAAGRGIDTVKRQRPFPAAVQVSSMAWNPISCRMMTARLHRFIPFPLVLIIRALDRNTPIFTIQGAPSMLLLQTMKRLLPLNTCPARRALSQLLKVPMPWPTP